MITRTDAHMTRTTYASIAGFTLLFYIAVGVAQLVLFGGMTAGEGTAAKLASMARDATEVRVDVVLGLLTCFVALVLAVALYAITRAGARSRHAGPGLSRRRGRDRLHLHTDDAGTALARDGHRRGRA